MIELFDYCVSEVEYLEMLEEAELAWTEELADGSSPYEHDEFIDEYLSRLCYSES